MSRGPNYGDVGAQVERSMHDEIRELLNSCWARFGIRIDSIRVDWIDTGGMMSTSQEVAHIRMETATDRFRTRP